MPEKKPQDFAKIKYKELEIALENRAFEIQLFWQRTNYFLVLITALGIGVFTIQDDWASILISGFAIFVSMLWFKTNLGSKFWQESWEQEVIILAEEMNIRSFERQTDAIIEQVKGSLLSVKNGGEKSRFRKYIDRKTLKKYSVSHHMIILSLFFIILWSLITLLFFIQLIFEYDLLRWFFRIELFDLKADFLSLRHDMG